LLSQWPGDGNEKVSRLRKYIIAEGRRAVYFRTDQVAVELKKYSVREIAPLP
jgi:hypothetical protein